MFYESAIPKFSLGVNFSTTFDFVPAANSAPYSNEAHYKGSFHSLKGQLSESRSSSRRRLFLDNEKIQKPVLAKTESTSNATATSENTPTGDLPASDFKEESSLIDFSSHASSSYMISKNDNSTKFLFDDFFSPSITTVSSPVSTTSYSKQTVEKESAGNVNSLGRNLSLVSRETVNIVCKSGKLVSQESKGSLSLKLQSNDQHHLTDAIFNDLLSAEISVISLDRLQTIKSWELSSAIFESIPKLQKPDSSTFNTSLQIIGDDRKLLNTTTGLALCEYSYHPKLPNPDMVSSPIKVRSHLSPRSLSVNDATSDVGKSSHVELSLSVEFFFPSHSSSSETIKCRGTKVQVSLSGLMSKINIEDITMQPSGSFDRNKRIVTWLCEDFSINTRSTLEFSAVVKFPTEQMELLTATGFLNNTFLPTMVRTQIFDLLSGIDISSATVAADQPIVNVSKVTQVEFKIA